MWLSVVTVDGAGKETQLGKRVFGTQFKDSKGTYPVEIQDAVGVGKDDRIPPMESVQQGFKLALPKGVVAADLTARLLYKSAPDELAKRAGVRNPTTVMAEATKRIFATDAARAADVIQPGSAQPTGTAAGSQSGPPAVLPMLICAGMVLLAGGLTTAFVVRARKAEKE